MWYMRGSISMDEAFMLSTEDREIINDIIKSNYEDTKKSGMPLI
tara:strand:- start:1232 stop:1363 length:132 start_codon:yes stop_codon:yes gene_type:complete